MPRALLSGIGTGLILGAFACGCGCQSPTTDPAASSPSAAPATEGRPQKAPAAPPKDTKALLESIRLRVPGDWKQIAATAEKREDGGILYRLRYASTLDLQKIGAAFSEMGLNAQVKDGTATGMGKTATNASVLAAAKKAGPAAHEVEFSIIDYSGGPK